MTLALGAYGMRLAGLDTRLLLREVPGDWPLVRLERRPLAEHMPEAAREAAELTYPNGWILRLELGRRRGTFFVPESTPDDELAHPYLSPLAVAIGGSLGYAVFHAGALVTAGGAWALFAERGGGKSTTLAAASAAGAAVMTDDVLLVSDGQAFAGPRCIDLRMDAAREFVAQAQSVRGGQRGRLLLPPIEPVLPLRGLFFLTWDETLACEPLGPSERLAELTRYVRPETRNLGQLLALAHLPGWRLRRPREPRRLGDACRQLLETASC